MTQKSKIDEKDDMIIRLLIRNPKLSDNEISRRLEMPVKTVNRRRKLLEENKIIWYMTGVNHYYNEHNHKGAGCLVTLTFRKGITRGMIQGFLEKYHEFAFVVKHVRFTFFGEQNGQVCLIFMLESRKQDDLVEIINAEIIRHFEHDFGVGVVDVCSSIPVFDQVRMTKNYIPLLNMDKGIMRDDWPDKNIFVR